MVGGVKATFIALLAFSLCLSVFIGCETAPTKPSEPPAKTKAQIEAEKKKFAETKAKAKQGNDVAQANLGWMYRAGLGVQQDYVKALKWHRKAIEQGNAVAQNNLGVMYRDGL